MEITKNMEKNRTYISLFSCAGVGCYGFKVSGFECVATNEYLPRRLAIQRYNKKCKYETGYICGDITSEETKAALFAEIDLWRKKDGLKRVDVVIATPPCQGMSVANHKKKSDEIVRNSLVIESIKIIKDVHPRFFVFENVPAFMRTVCTDIDRQDKPISEAIHNNLGKDYTYLARIINFKNHGACSSRQRCLVIGVSNDYANEVSPYELFPDFTKEKTLREVIGKIPSLKVMGEIDNSDIYHFFRKYPEEMRDWIHDLKEGESAFNNEDIMKKPHQIIDGEIIINKQKNGDKYRRQIWDKVGPCVHTRNDQLASQNTIHPADDRVFSIRELMKMMTIPKTFKWTERSLEKLNDLTQTDKREFLKKEENNIRQCLGEAVPTIVFKSIAEKINSVLNYQEIRLHHIKKIEDEYGLSDTANLVGFIEQNPLNLSPTTLSRIAELTNSKRIDNAAYFTSKLLITEIMKGLPDFDKDELYILEPSVGIGNFLPIIAKKYDSKVLNIDVVDIDKKCFEIIKALLKYYNLGSRCRINFICGDFLQLQFKKKYDLVVGNPPFSKLSGEKKKLMQYRQNADNKVTSNTSEFFLEKALKIGNYVALIMPKNLLNTPEFSITRDILAKKAVTAILDFGEKGFPGVTIETIAIFVDVLGKKKDTRVCSLTENIELLQKQKYIFDSTLPYWIIYRNVFFDKIAHKLTFSVFDVFRDRQLTKAKLNRSGDIRVIKARNISMDGSKILDLPGYDAYAEKETVYNLKVFDYLDTTNVYLTPNMTYYPRVIKKPSGVLADGSVAILIPKENLELSNEQLQYFSSNEYRLFFKIARNYQTRSLNVDACSVYFYGVLKR